MIKILIFQYLSVSDTRARVERVTKKRDANSSQNCIEEKPLPGYLKTANDIRLINSLALI